MLPSDFAAGSPSWQTQPSRIWGGKGCVSLPTQGHHLGHLCKNTPAYPHPTLIESESLMGPDIGSFVHTPQSPELQGHQTQGPALQAWGSGGACGGVAWPRGSLGAFKDRVWLLVQKYD